MLCTPTEVDWGKRSQFLDFTMYVKLGQTKCVGTLYDNEKKQVGTEEGYFYNYFKVNYVLASIINK